MDSFHGEAMNNRDRRYLPFAACGLELRSAAGGKPPTLVGYPIVCGAVSEPINGQFREIVHPDAVRSALGRDPDVRALIDHNPSAILGRTRAGTLTLTQDARGLRFECPLPNTSYAADLAESVKRGDVSGMSFGFDALRDSWQDQVRDGKRTSVRTLHDIDLHDVSVVTFPAYPEASVALRSLATHKAGTREDRILAEIGARIGAVGKRSLPDAALPDAALEAQSKSRAAHALSAKADASGTPADHAAAADAHRHARMAHHAAADDLHALADYHRTIAHGHGASEDMHGAKAKG